MKHLTLLLILALILISCSTRTYNFHVWQNGNMQYQYSEEVGDDGVISKKWAVVEAYSKQDEKKKDSTSLIEGQNRKYESGTQVVNVYVTAASERPLTISTDASFPLIP